MFALAIIACLLLNVLSAAAAAVLVNNIYELWTMGVITGGVSIVFFLLIIES